MDLSNWTTLLLLIAPAMMWAIYHHYKDVHQPEPWRWLLIAYLLGIGSGGLGAQAYFALDQFGLRRNAYSLVDQQDLYGLLSYAVWVIGPVEELVKFIPFWFVIRRIDHFDEPIDAIIYATFIALGFASYENYWYLQQMQGWEALGRAVASPLVHVVFASFWAYPIGWAHAHRKSEWWAGVIGLLVAAVVHGLYDFFALGFSLWARIVPPLIIGGLWLRHVNAMCDLAKLHHQRASLLPTD